VIQRDKDGCFHPTTEEQLVELVAHAHAHGHKIRVLGSSHSVWRSIVTDHFAGAATPPSELPIVLDLYSKVFEPTDDVEYPHCKRVEVQAGCHLGASPMRLVQGRIAPGGSRESDVLRPSPWHDETWENSFNSQIHHRFGLALSDLGGITHQTVAGFIATGSQGGTTKWSVHSGIVAMRIIDGTGKVHVLRRGGDDEEWFRAAGVAMGLCGLISTITFRCEPRYDLIGKETISATEKSDVLDFYGDRTSSGLPNLERFLLETDYTRLMWWPQWNFDRLVVWQATRQRYNPDLEIKPYHEIASFPVMSQVAASVIYTVLGNLDAPARIFDELGPLRSRADVKALVSSFFAPRPDPDFPYEPQKLFPWITDLVQTLRGERHDPITLSEAWIPLVQLLVVGADEVVVWLLGLPIMKQLFALLAKLVPRTIGSILGLFVTTGDNGAPATQHFQDRWLLGLPMDNQMDDLLMPTWFTELWMPFSPGDGKVQGIIDALRTVFRADGTPEGAYAATGAFSFELYAAKADPDFFLAPGAGTQNLFRVDVFWFGRNAGSPLDRFYPLFWSALKPFGFRLHWGKFLPEDRVTREHLLAQYPHLPRFKEVRKRVDPKNVFLNSYWQRALDL
jgi:D-arabinono-1,4-lactone oxidase